HTDQRTAHLCGEHEGPPDSGRAAVDFDQISACALNEPCYNRARLENLQPNCQAKKTDNSRSYFWEHIQVDEIRPAQTLLENRRCSADGWSFAFRDPVVGDPGPGTATAHRQQIPPVHRGRRESAEAGALYAKSGGAECTRNRANAQARRPGSSESKWYIRSNWRAPSTAAQQAQAFSGRRREFSRNLCGIPERAGTLADERISQHLAEAGTVL